MSSLRLAYNVVAANQHLIARMPLKNTKTENLANCA